MKQCVAPVSGRRVTRGGGPCRVARRPDSRGLESGWGRCHGRNSGDSRPPAPPAAPADLRREPPPTRRLGPGRQPVPPSGRRAPSGCPTTRGVRRRAPNRAAGASSPGPGDGFHAVQTRAVAGAVPGGRAGRHDGSTTLPWSLAGPVVGALHSSPLVTAVEVAPDALGQARRRRRRTAAAGRLGAEAAIDRSPARRRRWRPPSRSESDRL